MPENIFILKQVTSADANNIISYYKPTIGNSGYITTLKLKIDIQSINEANFPYIPDSTPPDVLEGILNEVALNTPFKEIRLLFRKGSGAWIERASMRIFNKQPYYDANLLRYFTDANTIDVAEDMELGIQIPPGLQNQLVANSDTIVIWGSAVEEKKNDPGLEALSNRLSALESLLSVFGAPSATLPGTNGLVPAPPAGGGSRLLRGDRTWQDPDDFVSIAEAETIGGSKTFSNLLTSLKEVVALGAGILSGYASRTAATLFATGGGAYLSLTCAVAASNSKSVDLELNSQGFLSLRRINDAYSAVISNIFRTDAANNLTLFGFTTLGDNVALKVKVLSGTTAVTQGGQVTIAHGIADESKIRSLLSKVDQGNGQGVCEGMTVLNGYEYNTYYGGGLAYLHLKSGNSAQILGKPFFILVLYTN